MCVILVLCPWPYCCVYATMYMSWRFLSQLKQSCGNLKELNYAMHRDGETLFKNTSGIASTEIYVVTDHYLCICRKWGAWLPESLLTGAFLILMHCIVCHKTTDATWILQLKSTSMKKLTGAFVKSTFSFTFGHKWNRYLCQPMPWKQPAESSCSFFFFPQ